MVNRIALVDDDQNILTSVSLALEAEGFIVDKYLDGEQGLNGIIRRPPDLAVLDIKMPRLDGMEVLEKLRKSSNLPVIFLTSKDDEVDEALGLRIGADDYIKKPFSQRLLIERVKAILRRSKGPREKSIQMVEFGEVRIDIKRAEITSEGQVIATTAQEWALLIYLLENRGQVMSRRQILNGAWELDWIGDERTVDVHVRQLRKKLGPSFQLKTVRGMGYRLD